MITEFLYNNFKWNFNQNSMDGLLSLSTTKEQFETQLEKLARRYFPESKQINLFETEFLLNKVALSKAKDDAQKIAKSNFASFWNDFLRIKQTLNKRYLTFPSGANKTRLELIAELIAKCTQFSETDETITQLADTAVNTLQLTERESRYLKYVIDLYKINFYCIATIAALKNKSLGRRSLAKMLRPNLLKQNYSVSKKYCQSQYQTKRLNSVIDCMGNSLARFDDIAVHVSLKTFIYANGRNVFDTFIENRFGYNVAEFRSVDKSLKVHMLYFLQGCMEVRKFSVTNTSKCKRKFSVEIPVKHDVSQIKTSYFKMADALCLTIDKENFYCANALIADNEIVNCYGDQSLNYDFSLESNATKNFDIVTIYAENTPTLTQELESLEYFGATACPYVFDEQCNDIKYSDVSLNLSAHGYVFKKPNRTLSTALNFSYQLGNSDLATFIDNAGNCATLIKGFVFGVKGESIYSVRNGIIDKINETNFHIDVDRLRYDKANSSCVIYHDAAKVYEITHVKPCKTLIYLPFQQKSQVIFKNNIFQISDEERNYTVEFENKIESYTTNALECSEEKLRYKLSNDSSAGHCLAVCIETSTNVKFTVNTDKSTSASAPIVRESLVSTYLNYINDKNVFCLNNHLKRPDCLTVAAICYTNPQYVKNYVKNIYSSLNGKQYYYDATGEKKYCRDRLSLPLACVYYLNLIKDDLPTEIIQCANGILFNEEFADKDLCVKALILKKAAQLTCMDKVRCLIEYNLLKKKICNDSKLYAYAQAIGAVPMTNPSKSRLKDLCNKYDIPKSWYYVSQLENLYGLSISSGKLHICPKVTAENALEQFALNINGKRIDTTFTKSTVRSMTLNGAQCYQPFFPDKLKNTENRLVVRY